MPVAPEIEYRIEIPEKVSAKYDNGKLTIKGPKGEISRVFMDDNVRMELDGKVIRIYVKLPKKRDAAIAGTWNAHVRNMINGVENEYTYKLKVVYAHFPMKINVKGKEIVIENFLGEKRPRKALIYGNVKVEVKNDIILVHGPNIEDVGQTAANIERATRIKDYDPRVFQDGIYIINKGEEE
ncbi:MAG: 50S ribosomal protein L6 [Thermoplasmata archaeon]